MTGAASSSSSALKSPKRHATVAVVGSPNAGKTSIFNALTGLRAKTANFPGTTTDVRRGRHETDNFLLEIVDLPGTYSLKATSGDEQVAVDALLGRAGSEAPDGIILLLDATNLSRHLFLASEVIELGIPCVVALNMHDLAQRHGIQIDIEKLSKELACPVIPTAAPSKRGIKEVMLHVDRVLQDIDDDYHPTVPIAFKGDSTPVKMRYDWADRVAGEVIISPPTAVGSRSDAIDRWVTHPTLGVLCFFGAMFGLFYLIFSLASIPMDLIDGAFGWLGAKLAETLPPGQLNSLVTDGMVPGVAGVLIFLPQICILFFLTSLLEDSGYLARAAFVMDRLMRRFGLPGKAFVPMLCAHACAIPAIMATRVIEDKRDRLATILVAPLMTCSARLPVYAMVTALLFPADPLKGSLVFTGAYMLGIVAAISMAFVFKKTILPGESRPLILELPSYKAPSLRNALLTMWDRGFVFVKKAGTVILALSVLLWWMATYPQLDEADLPAVDPVVAQQVESLRQESDALASQAKAATGEVSAELLAASNDKAAEADHVFAQRALEYSVSGRIGHVIEPIFRPLGYDWRVSVAVLSSFAAREVVVSTLGVLYGVGDDVVDDNRPLIDKLHDAKRADGTPLFNTPTAISFLVFFVLAMQCLPTQAVTKRETGSWKWALFQLGYMTALAYCAALVAYQGLTLLGA